MDNRTGYARDRLALQRQGSQTHAFFIDPTKGIQFRLLPFDLQP